MKKIIFISLFFICSQAIADSFEENLKELFELTQVKNDYISLNTIIIRQMQAGFFRAAEQNIDGSNFTEEQNRQAGEILKSRFSVMVENYKSHIEKVMPYEKVENEVFIPLYKDAYTEDEVKELIKFYKSPIGKKSVEVSKKLSQQVTQRASEKYDSLIVKFVEEQITDNIEILKNELAEQNLK